MARHSVFHIAIFVLALVCLIQAKENIGTFHHDMVEDFMLRLMETIRKENITCKNYVTFCEKSNKQFQTSNDPKSTSANEMAIELCKGILKSSVCEENDI